MPWVWWLMADRELRRLSRVRMWHRLALFAFVLAQTALFATMILSRAEAVEFSLPMPLLASAYIWHLIVAPLALIAMIGLSIGRAGWWIGQRVTSSAPAPAPVTEPVPAAPEASEEPAPRLTRRELFAGALAAAPPLILTGASIRSLDQLTHFRIREIEISLPTLPQALDGLRIAHLTDLHVGKFTTGKVLREIAAATNDLGADLVLFTGDLIDHSLEQLPEAIAILERLNPRSGLALCEGNHDLFDDRVGFENGLKSAGMPLLLNEASETRIRGERVQLLGLRWGRAGAGRDALLAPHMETVKQLINPAAFPILLAHHPHAFDHAAAAGIPLTLAGHTHGGQLMLGLNLGPGPMMYRYWSGLYRKGNSALVVSNGTGNWFPLRINAPAEILHLTLRRATPT